MGPKETKKALTAIRKFLSAKAQEGAHDEIREYLETHADEIGPLVGCAGDHVREAVAAEHAKAVQNIATLELYRAFLLQTFPPSEAADETKHAYMAEVSEYVRSHVPSLMAAFGVSDPDRLKLFETRDHALLAIPERIERLRGNLTRVFRDMLKEASRYLTREAGDEDLRRAQAAADKILGKQIADRWELDPEEVFACALGAKEDDMTCFESVFAKVFVPAWRLKAARAAIGKRRGLQCHFVDRGERPPRLLFSWPSGAASWRIGYLALRGPAPNRGARVVTVSLREARASTGGAPRLPAPEPEPAPEPAPEPEHEPDDSH